MKQVTKFGHYIFIYSIVQQYLVQEILVQGQCSFDSKWMDLWWRQYNGSTSVTQKFTNAGKITIKNGATTKSYTCNGIESENLGFNYIRNEDGKADKECAYGYVTQTTKTTFVEQVAALPSAASSAGPRDCTPYLQNAPVNVMINAKFNFNQSACSVIPLGMYNVAYYENSATKMCDGDDTSRMTVTANEIEIATCTKTGTYEKPYLIKLTCVDYLKANILGYDESKGNVMILAFEDLSDKQKFYCAKYSTDVPSRKVYMSLHINQGEGVKCQKDQDSKMAGDQYRAFEMQLNHCLSVPCKNNGNCTDLWQNYICSCLPGFTGQQCETNIDECSSQPCMNGATCMDEINEYKCQCPPDYTGVHCDKELCSLPMEWNSTGPFWQQYNTVNSGISLKSYSKIDTKISTLTPPSPLNSILFCQSNSTVGDYTYFTSTQITKPLPQVDFCTENKLVGNFMLHREKQTATLQPSSATCPTVLGSRVKTSVYVKYPFDFSSFNCPFPSATYQFAYSEDGNLDTCSSNMASAAEVAKNINIKGCFTGTASYKKPFNGEIECVGNLTAAEFDAPGSSNPDVLILAQKDESSSYRFYCARYKIVDTKIILSLDVSNKEKLACRSDKTLGAALNDQFVKLTLSSMECSKVPGPCLNNGTCNQKLAAYTCTCQPGFTGTNCETNIDECVSQPCQNGGTCVDDINSYNCTCSNNFIGTHCETPNNCWNSPCQNGGTCQEITGDYQCKCAPGYEGKNCSINTDECKSNPCQNGGTCNDFINGYNCTCKVGTTGPNCESDFDECLSGPCQNGGTCHDRINGYICRCPKTHIGTHCESINECYPQPCLNGATCVDDHLFYKCNCTDGYTGKDCESNVDDCAGAPCKNNATCIDGLNGFTCKCAKGFLGRLCDTEINACLSSPCVHGRCENRLGGYICRCPSGYYGEKCQLQSPLKLEADIITVIILSIFAVVSVAVIIVVLIMLHYRRRRRQAKEKYLMGASNGVAASQTNSVKSAKSWYPDYGKDSVNSPYNSPNSAL